MSKTIKSLICIFFISAMISSEVSAAQVVNINDLIENLSTYNGKEVTVAGEALGEALERGDHAWINISDGTNAIGIWLDTENASKLTYFGNYNNIGDTIQISGIFYRACNEHGGDVDIHCNNFQIIKSGYSVKKNLLSIKVIIAVVLLIFNLILFLFYCKVKRKDSEIH